jgi:hypothetical protein
MTHPITPPPELVQQWASEKCYDKFDCLYELHIANRAAQWGADKELDACCELMDRDFMAGPSDLRAARRPRPPSLKEQALAILNDAHRGDLGNNEIATIRRALETLPE